MADNVDETRVDTSAVDDTATARPLTAAPADTLPVQPVLLHDRVRWGPILAGVFTAFATRLILTVLGFAIGVSVYDVNTTNPVLTVGKSAALWSAGSALIAFFVGGWLAAKTAAVAGDGAALANGFVVGALGLFFMAFFTTVLGLGGLLGAAGIYLSNIVNLGKTVGNNVSPSQIYNAASTDAWIAFLVVVLVPIAAMLGGWLCHNSRADVIARVPTVAPTAGRGRELA